MAGGTSLAVIAPNSANRQLGQLRCVSIDWTRLGSLLFAFPGCWPVSRFARRLPEKLLRRLFAIALIVLALAIALLNF